MLSLAIVFVGLIVYGSLYPFTGWVSPEGPLLDFLTHPPLRVQKADLVQNVLAYLPLGLFLGAWLMQSMRLAGAIAVAGLAGAALSLAMEIIQQYLPSRDPSVVDLALNLLGTVGGAVLASFLRGHGMPGNRLRVLRESWLISGNTANLGLAALALWALSQTSPLVPTLDPGQLRAGLALLAQAVLRPQDVMLAPMFSYACYLAGLGLLVRMLAREGHSALKLFAAVVAVVFVLKIIVEGRNLSAEALGGAVLAFLLLAVPSAGRRAWRAWAWSGMFLVGLGFVVIELTPGQGYVTRDFNWVPFAGQMRSLAGLQNILELVWPFFAMACFARFLRREGRQRLALVGGVAVALCVFWLEWMQQDMAGRYGDVTQVMLAWTGWMLPWCFKASVHEAGKGARTPRAPAQGASADSGAAGAPPRRYER